MKTIHILLVEDNEGDILLTTEALNDAKIVNDVSVVKDGWDAVRFIEQRDEFSEESLPDLILLDVNLPRMNGHEVLQYIKENDAIKHIPVIMLTTSSAESDIMKSYRNHANCYITKPVDVNDFIAVVTSIEDFWVSIVQLPTQAGK